MENSSRHGNTKPPYLPPEKSVCRSGSNRHGEMNLFQIRKGVCQGCAWSPCLYNLYAEYIMQNARLDEAQAEIKIEVKLLSCPTLCDPVDCCLPGSSIHGILQAIILEWVAISFSRGSSLHRDQTQVSRFAGIHTQQGRQVSDRARIESNSA